MKKKNLLVLPIALSLFACGGPSTSGSSASGNSNSSQTSTTNSTSSGKQQVLYICVYDGGYGTEWIEQMARDYEAKTGVKVVAEVDQQILDRLEDQLENTSDYDIYMSHDINWQNFAARDLLANLDDLYSREVEGTGKTFEQRTSTGAADMSRTENGKGEVHYYKACYTQGAGGLVYNIDMFEENGWTVPTTYAELQALCTQITNAEIEIPGSRNTVVPFAWSGQDRQYYWDYLVFEWWAQLAGVEKLNSFAKFLGPTGKYSDGYEVFNPESNYKEFLQAYDMWHSLIALNPTYSTEDAYSKNLLSAQSAFANGQAAMIPYGQWAKLEIEKAIDRDLSFDVAMMKTPKVTATSIDYNYLVGFGDSMIIPQNSPNKELAKDFLAYMATPEACRTFVEKADGAFLAFDYSDVDLSEIEATNTYVKSVREKLTDCTSFHLASKNPMTYWNSNVLMPWIQNNYYYQSACSNPSNYTAEKVGKIIYDAAKAGWRTWMSSAGVRD